MDDAALVQGAARGDEDAFELLVRRHTENVWRLAMGVLRDPDEAEEATQDTFLKAYRALASFRGDAGVGTWLHTICRRTCLDRLRRSSPEAVELEKVRTARARAARLDDRMALREALAELGQDEREAFALVDALGYTSEEASRLCDVPASTMRSRVARARGRLADALSEGGEAVGGSRTR